MSESKVSPPGPRPKFRRNGSLPLDGGRGSVSEPVGGVEVFFGGVWRGMRPGGRLH